MKNLVSIFSILIITTSAFADGDCLGNRELNLPTIKLEGITNVLASMSSDGKVSGILYEDDRETIYEPDQNELTQSMKVGRLQIASIDGTVKSCSGTLVGKNLVLTAAHCFYSGANNTISSGKVTFTLQQSNEYAPFGSVGASKVLLPKDFFLDVSDEDGKITLSQRENDYALIVLNEDIGEEHGWHEIKADDDATDEFVNLASYPGDKNRHLTYEECDAFESESSKAIYEFDCDIAKGASGSALINENNIVLAVVSSSSTYSNFATRFTRRSMKIIKSWVEGSVSKQDTYEVKLSQNPNYKLILKNKCNKTINVAYKVKKADGYKKGGLYILKSGEEMSLSNVTSKEYFFYAKVQGTKSEWRGKTDIYLDAYNQSYPFKKAAITSRDISATHIQSFKCN